MNSHNGGWVFGPNFDLNKAADVYTEVNDDGMFTPMPIMGYFLWLNGGIFTLLNGQSLVVL
jgi:hypothetical protein